MKRIATALVVAVSLMIGLGACVPQAEESGKPIVYASFYPIYDLVDSIAGDTIDLRVFMPADKDPQMWEPTPKDMQELTRADLLIVNGANFEPWLDQVSEAVPDLDVVNLADYAELISYQGAAAVGEFQYLARTDLQPGTDYSIIFGHTHEKEMRLALFDNTEGLAGKDLVNHARTVLEEQGEATDQGGLGEVDSGHVYRIRMAHQSGRLDFRVPHDGDWIFVSDRISEQLLPYQLVDRDGREVPAEKIIEGSSTATEKVIYDPHSWMSLSNAKRYANAINDTLRERYPEHRELYAANKFALVSSISELHNEYRMKFKDLSRTDFVVNHNAYEYLARDVGDITQHPLQGLTSMGDPSIRSLVTAIRFVEDNDISHVYYEADAMPMGADTIAAEVGGETLPLTSMEFVAPGTPAADKGYVGIMRTNLENLHVSLQ